MKLYRILVIRYSDGQLRRVNVVAEDRAMAIVIAEHLHGEVVEG